MLDELMRLLFVGDKLMDVGILGSAIDPVLPLPILE
jgi:hypothetical protein